MTEKIQTACGLAAALISSFSANEFRRSRYGSDLVWLQEWYERWNADRVRVGVIGVTSSGKSTLINAILGNALLSVAVRPSSSQLVSCSYAQTTKATVYFCDKTSRGYTDDELTSDIIREYSDERYNHGNEKQVAQLELSTANFGLGEDILLIDSPGLDAVGLEIHEKLTLETLLPTVDLCIFVTTTKSNSDEKMRSVLNTIAKHGCPVIVAQNMLDAVSPSVDGKKSAVMVAAELRTRAERVIQNSMAGTRGQTEFVQISAINAMNYRCDMQTGDTPEVMKQKYVASQYDQFVDGVKRLVAIQRPEIEAQRMRTIKQHISELIKSEESLLGGIEITVDQEAAQEAKIGSIEEQLAAAKKTSADSITAAFTQLRAVYDRYFPQNFQVDDVPKIQDGVRSCEKMIEAAVTTYTRESSKIISALDIPVRDVLSFNGLPTVPAARKKTKTESYSYKVDKGFGFISAITDGRYGTRTVWDTREVTDVEGTRQSAKAYLERVLREYAQTVDAWSKSASATAESIQHELTLRKNAIQERKKQQLGASEWRKLKKELLLLLRNTESPDTRADSAQPTFSSKTELARMIPMRISPQVFAIRRMAERYTRQIQHSALRAALDAFENRNDMSLIVASDEESARAVAMRFWDKETDKLPEGRITQLDNKTAILYIPNEKAINEFLAQSGGCNLFVLTNGYGASTNGEDETFSLIAACMRESDLVFPVIQDFEALVNGNGVRDAVGQVCVNYTKRYGQDKGFVLINHSNPIYNLAIIQNQIFPHRLQADEVALQNALRKSFPPLVKAKTQGCVVEIIRGSNYEQP